MAAGVTYRTATYGGGNSTWTWRVPSAVQGVFSILCIAILPFIPESPRWLVYVNRRDEALQVVAQTYANGDSTNAMVLAAYKEIVDTINYEKNVGETLTLVQMVKTPVARKRMTLAISCAVFSTISGNVIASYYLGSMLTNAGITNTTTQLKIVSRPFHPSLISGLIFLEYHPKRLVSHLCSHRYILPRPHRPPLDRHPQHRPPNHLPLYNWRSHQTLRNVNQRLRYLRHSSSNFPLPRCLQFRLDTPPLPVSARSAQLPHPRKRDGRLHVRPEWRGVALCV